MILIHNNCILDRDDNSIEEIKNNDIIIIVENKIYKDDSYYKSLTPQNKGKKNIQININSIRIDLMIFPEITTFSQMLKSIYLKFGKTPSELRLLNYREYKNSNEEIKYIISGYLEILRFNETESIIGGEDAGLGKTIEAEIINEELPLN